MKIFARWKERRKKKRQLRKMSQVLDKLTEAAVIAFGDGCRLQVPVDLFEEDDMVSKFINQVTKEIGSSVRANSAHGAITFYEDGEDGLSDGKEIVVVTVG